MPVQPGKIYENPIGILWDGLTTINGFPKLFSPIGGLPQMNAQGALQKMWEREGKGQSNISKGTGDQGFLLFDRARCRLP